MVSGTLGNSACPAARIVPDSFINGRAMTVAADYHGILRNRRSVDVTLPVRCLWLEES